MKTHYRSTDYKVNKRYNMKEKKQNSGWSLTVVLAIAITAIVLLGFCSSK